MFLPVAHANPTKFISALRAGHMVAPLVLLYVPLALRADFRVGCNPINIFRFSTRLLVPHFGRLAVTRFMHVLSTTKAKFGATVAYNIIEHASHVRSLATELALHVWAPLDIFVVVCE